MGSEEKAPARPRSHGLFWPAWLGGLALLGLLATLASVYDYFPADLRIAHWIQREGGIPLWGGVAGFLRDLGGLTSTLLWVLATALLLLSRRYPEGMLVFSSFLPRLAQGLLKEAVQADTMRFLQPILNNLCGGGVDYIGRKASSSPATGFPSG